MTDHHVTFEDVMMPNYGSFGWRAVCSCGWFSFPYLSGTTTWPPFLGDLHMMLVGATDQLTTPRLPETRHDVHQGMSDHGLD